MTDSVATRYRWDDLPQEELNPLLAPAADLHRADDARPRLPRAGLRRPEALARERAAHLHPRGHAAVLARRGRLGGRRRRGRRGAAHPVERAAHGRGAREDARRRHLLPAPRRTGSTAPTPTCGRSEPRARGTRSRSSAARAAGSGARSPTSWRPKAHRSRSARATPRRSTRRQRDRDAPAPRLAVAADLSVAGEPARGRGLRRALRPARHPRHERRRAAVPGGFESFGAEDWERATALAPHSTVELARAALPGMRSGGWGRILFVTSIAAQAAGRQPACSRTALRPAVTGFAHSLAREVAKDGITVNTILPGYTRPSA